MYKQEVIPEFQLPPIHVPPKHPKKQSPASILSSKASYERSGEFPMDIGEMEESFSKKSPSKVARRDEPIFAPRSLFDRPSPALAKLRRDYRLQKYSCRPTAPAAVKNVLGPGSVTFPIIPSPSAKPPPAPPADMAEWMVAEDYALLQVCFLVCGWHNVVRSTRSSSSIALLASEYYANDFTYVAISDYSKSFGTPIVTACGKPGSDPKLGVGSRNRKHDLQDVSNCEALQVEVGI